MNIRNTNIISFEELSKVINILDVKNVDTDEIFDFIKVLKSQDNDTENNNVLYFPVYIYPTDDEGGWYIRTSDQRLKINEYIEKHPKYTYILDYNTYETIENKNIKIIFVEDIMKSLDLLFNYYLKIRNFKTILVTGSVGKTSTVGLIEKVIKEKVLRIYSKRITPVVLKAKIINRLTEDIEYVVLEAGLFHKHHVKYFSDILKPYIGVCINILPEHIGINGIKDIKDITISKVRIFEYAEHALINLKDKELSKIKFAEGKLNYENISFSSKIKKVYDISELNKNIKLYIQTKLSKIQYQVAYQVGMILNISEDKIVERLNKAIPVENRTNKQTIYDKEIIFDGDVSGVARFSLFTDHLYEEAVLVIRELTYEGEETEDYSLLKQYFNRFKKVYLFNSLENLEELIYENTQIVSSNEFIKNIDYTVKIFYHYGSYYRKFKNFEVKNLEMETKPKKILLIHGWNYDNYYNRISHSSWENRSKFVNELEKKYEVRRPDLPGFGLEKAPNKKSYTINDYANFINEYIEKNNFHPDYILGYSFGGAVAVTYYKNYGSDSKLILVSPALIRNTNNSKKYIKTPKFLKHIRNFVRNLYLIYKIKVPEMVYGTKFLRETYQSIVRVEIIDYLEEIDKNNFIIIYGDKDDMVDPKRMVNSVSAEVKNRIKFIKNGGHDIANTHTSELIDVVNKYINNEEKNYQ